jgi:hypothetical protein
VSIVGWNENTKLRHGCFTGETERIAVLHRLDGTEPRLSPLWRATAAALALRAMLNGHADASKEGFADAPLNDSGTKRRRSDREKFLINLEYVRKIVRLPGR